MKINIFILAAGFGTRLRPISHEFPKPLLPVLGKPLLHYILERVTVLDFNRIGINVHYLQSMMQQWLTSSPFAKYLEIFPEEELLGTGGGLKNARTFLDKSSFLVHNADILTNIDLNALIDRHISSGHLVTLAVHNCERFNHLHLDQEGFLKGVGKTIIDTASALKPMAFTGVAVYLPEFFEFLPDAVSSVVNGWLRAVESGYGVATMDVSGCEWNDLGTPETYIDSVVDKLRAEGETLYIHPSAKIQGPIELNGMVSIEANCVVGKGAYLKDCLLMPGIVVEENARFNNCILTGESEIQINNRKHNTLSSNHNINRMLLSVFSPPCPPPETTLIGSGGSDRLYYRVSQDGHSAVLMVCAQEDQDFERHLALTECFGHIAIPVPKLLAADSRSKMALFEDLGDLTLYSKLKFTSSTQETEDLYKAVIQAAIRLHTEGINQIDRCPSLKERLFDYDHARWETNYFMERFVGDLCKIKVKNRAALDAEFHQLALTLDSLPKTVIHRDFQSQNIMIRHGNTIGIVDFQGARIGPPVYDIVSLLWDPYANLQEDSRQKLLEYYIEQSKKTVEYTFSEEKFRASLLTARLQRHMQALGAYSFLALVKGKKYFLKHVPNALSYLKEEVNQTKERYPNLYMIAIKLMPEI